MVKLNQQLSDLICIHKDLKLFREKIHESLRGERLDEVYESFEESNETLWHRLVYADGLKEQDKVHFAYVLADACVDINAQNRPSEQTALHLAISKGLEDLTQTLLQCGSDLTLTDIHGLCSYNYAKRLEDKDVSKRIIQKMQAFYPTYWLGVQTMDINVIRRLINNWVRFKVKKNGKYLTEFAVENKFKPALDLFHSLEIQMDLYSAVMAVNLLKVKDILTNHSAKLRLNFKNMKEKNANIFYYAIKQNNFELLKLIIDYSGDQVNILNEYLSDELDVKLIDYPLFFVALESRLELDSLELLLSSKSNNTIDLSDLYYRGLSFLRYSVEIRVDPNLIEKLLIKHCSKELITVKDPNFLTCKEYCLKTNKPKEYVNMIDRVTVNYIITKRYLRQQLALNGFDFDANMSDLTASNDGISLELYAKQNLNKELIAFMEKIELYQKKINEFHDAVMLNDYCRVKGLYQVDNLGADGEIFEVNIILSKKKNESQSVIFKAVHNNSYEILSLLLEFLAEDSTSSKRDMIRDHAYRSPIHYASALSKKSHQLLSQFGFSYNVYDKDGQTPLDFEEREKSEELQALLRLHKSQDFSTQEPNPWSWQVWTRIQRERNTLKQLISFSHPHLHPSSDSHAHKHSHNHGRSYSHCESNNQIGKETKTQFCQQETKIVVDKNNSGDRIQEDADCTLL